MHSVSVPIFGPCVVMSLLPNMDSLRGLPLPKKWLPHTARHAWHLRDKLVAAILRADRFESGSRHWRKHRIAAHKLRKKIQATGHDIYAPAYWPLEQNLGIK